MMKRMTTTKMVVVVVVVLEMMDECHQNVVRAGDMFVAVVDMIGPHQQPSFACAPHSPSAHPLLSGSAADDLPDTLQYVHPSMLGHLCAHRRSTRHYRHYHGWYVESCFHILAAVLMLDSLYDY